MPPWRECFHGGLGESLLARKIPGHGQHRLSIRGCLDVIFGVQWLGFTGMCSGSVSQLYAEGVR